MPICKEGGGKIVLERKSSGANLNKMPVAVNGDRIACGCPDNFIQVMQDDPKKGIWVKVLTH